MHYITPSELGVVAPRRWKTPLGEEADGRELVVRSYMSFHQEYKQVVVRKLREKLYNKAAFDEDIKALVAVQDNPSSSRAGYDFLAHFLAFGTDKTIGGNWIASEGVTGLALDTLLQSRLFMGWYLAPRSRYEIMYQVAYGMRFLEVNGLCHRHLRCSNVVVENEQYNHFAIKITDHMVPYHFCRPEAASRIDLLDMDWPWWAPESCNNRCFDILTDIWAYGCVAFEIMHNGRNPYAFEEPPLTKADEIVQFFASGNRMKTIESPEDLETFVDDVIQKCMSVEAYNRPTFVHLSDFFRELLFDPSLDPSATVHKYWGKETAKYDHKFKRGKLTTYNEA